MGRWLWVQRRDEWNRVEVEQGIGGRSRRDENILGDRWTGKLWRRKGWWKRSKWGSDRGMVDRKMWIVMQWARRIVWRDKDTKSEQVGGEWWCIVVKTCVRDSTPSRGEKRKVVRRGGKVIGENVY